MTIGAPDLSHLRYRGQEAAQRQNENIEPPNSLESLGLVGIVSSAFDKV